MVATTRGARTSSNEGKIADDSHEITVNLSPDAGPISPTMNNTTSAALVDRSVASRAVSISLNDLKPVKSAMIHDTPNAERATALRITGNVTIESSSASFQTMTAISQVFNTAELLENILVYVPPFELLVTAQRVCRGFKRVMYGSTQIGRLLFREKDPNKQFTWFPFGLGARHLGGYWNLHGSISELRSLLDRSPTLTRTFVSQPVTTKLKLALMCWDSKSSNNRCSRVMSAYIPGERHIQTFGDVLEEVELLHEKLIDNGRRAADYERRGGRHSIQVHPY